MGEVTTALHISDEVRDEIRCAFREAKDKRKQIGILSELHAMPVDAIRQIIGEDELAKHHLAPKKRKASARSQWTPAHEKTLREMASCGKSSFWTRSTSKKSRHTAT